jgi:hypothetical protein
MIDMQLIFARALVGSFAQSNMLALGHCFVGELPIRL